MSEKIVPGPLQDCSASIQEAVCINTKKIFDSCRDQDCIEDLRFYPVQCGQDVINNAVSVKNAKAELLHVYTDVEPINFNRGFYTVDLLLFLPAWCCRSAAAAAGHGSGRALCV